MLYKDDDKSLKFYCPICYKEMLRSDSDETENTCINCNASYWSRDLSEEEVKKRFEQFNQSITKHHD